MSETRRTGIIMNGVTGRMGANQHLLRSIVPIIRQGGVEAGEGVTILPDPILVGRNGAKLEALAKSSGIEKFTTDGVFLTKWGGTGSADGQLSSPLGIAVAHDEVAHLHATEVGARPPVGVLAPVGVEKLVPVVLRVPRLLLVVPLLQGCPGAW